MSRCHRHAEQAYVIYGVPITTVAQVMV